MATTEMPNWFVRQYEKRAQHIYQAKGNRLKGTVTAPARIEGTKVIFRLIGKGTARRFVRAQAAVPANTKRSTVETSLVTNQYFDEVHDFDSDRASDPNGAQERELIFEQGGMAIGRQADQDILDVFAGAAPTSGSRFIDLGATAFNAAYGLTACQRLQAADVPWDGNVFCALPSLLWNQLIAAKQVNNADHVGQDLPFTKTTDTRFWNGVNWFLFPDSMFPVPTAGFVDVFMWHREAAGHCGHTDLKTTWAWDNRLTCWTVNMLSKSANVAIQPEGMVRLRVPTTTSITLD